MLPIGTLQFLFDALVSGLQNVVYDTQAAGAEINSTLLTALHQIFGALSVIPAFPNL